MYTTSGIAKGGILGHVPTNWRLYPTTWIVYALAIIKISISHTFRRTFHEPRAQVLLGQLAHPGYALVHHTHILSYHI